MLERGLPSLSICLHCMRSQLHYATFTGLAHMTLYFYRYEDSALALPSQEHSVGSLYEEGHCNILSQQCDR